MARPLRSRRDKNQSGKIKYRKSDECASDFRYFFALKNFLFKIQFLLNSASARSARKEEERSRFL